MAVGASATGEHSTLPLWRRQQKGTILEAEISSLQTAKPASSLVFHFSPSSRGRKVSLVFVHQVLVSASGLPFPASEEVSALPTTGYQEGPLAGQG